MNSEAETAVAPKAPQFTENPFMNDGSMDHLPKATKQQQARKRAAVFEPATGQQIGECDGFYRKIEVDATQHIKLYLEGTGALAKLTKPGLAVFQIMYCQMLKSFDKDKIMMTALIARKYGIARTTYFAGITSLIETGFIAKTDIPPLYWINPKYIFNGNRLRFVQDYDLKQDKSDDMQLTVAAIKMTVKPGPAKRISAREEIEAQQTSEQQQIDVEDYIESQQDQDATASERGDAAAQSEQSNSRTGEARRTKKAPQTRLKATG